MVRYRLYCPRRGHIERGPSMTATHHNPNRCPPRRSVRIALGFGYREGTLQAGQRGARLLSGRQPTAASPRCRTKESVQGCRPAHLTLNPWASYKRRPSSPSSFRRSPQLDAVDRKCFQQRSPRLGSGASCCCLRVNGGVPSTETAYPRSLETAVTLGPHERN